MRWYHSAISSMALSTPLVLLRWNSDIPRETPLERRAITDRREAIREYLAEASISSGGSANERRLKREGNRMWTSLSSRSTRSPRFEGALVDVPANCSRRRRTGMSKTYQSDSKGGVSSLRRLPERPCTYPGSGRGHAVLKETSIRDRGRVVQRRTPIHRAFWPTHTWPRALMRSPSLKRS